MRARTAARVREEKEQHPERFCLTRGCLWRTSTRSGYSPCLNHPTATPDVLARAKALSTTDTSANLLAAAFDFANAGNFAARDLFVLAAREAERTERAA